MTVSLLYVKGKSLVKGGVDGVRAYLPSNRIGL